MNETRYFCQVCKRELKGEIQKQFAVSIEPCKHCIQIASIVNHESGWSEGYNEGRKDGRNNLVEDFFVF